MAAGLVSSSAQVYSANVVGYINVSLTNGFTMVANQLDVDGTGTNNNIATVMGTAIPANTVVEAWNGVGFSSTKWTGTKWTVSSALFTNAMQPQVGFFVSSPANTNIVEVGNVLQGTNTVPVAPGFQVVSFKAPITGGIASALGYVPTKNDVVEIWNGVGFSSHKWSGTIWTAGEPSLQVGQAVFLDAVATNNWTQGFTVQ